MNIPKHKEGTLVNIQEKHEAAKAIMSSYKRLGAQGLESLPIRVTHVVTRSSIPDEAVSKRPVALLLDICPDQIQHVSVDTGPTAGLCARMIFDGKLFATSGKDAEDLVRWALAVTVVNARTRITRPPDVNFLMTASSVIVTEGEIALA